MPSLIYKQEPDNRSRPARARAGADPLPPAPPTPPAPQPTPEPSVAELRDRYPALRAVELWRGSYSRALYAIVPGAWRLLCASAEHAEEFARHLADTITAPQRGTP
ncbi:hypothetical protein GCM10027570_13410 [Streptomonospora sediminis]